MIRFSYVLILTLALTGNKSFGQPDTLVAASRRTADIDILQAIDDARLAVRVAEGTSNRMQLARAYENLGFLLIEFDNSQMQKGLEYLYAGSQQYFNHQTPASLARYEFLKGYMALKRNLLADAELHYKRSLQQYLKLLKQNPEHSIQHELYKFYINIGNINSLLDNEEDALEYYNEGISYVRQYEKDTLATLLELYFAKGSYLSQLNRYNESIEVLDRAMEILKTSTNYISVDVVLTQGINYQALGDLEKAENHFKMAGRLYSAFERQLSFRNQYKNSSRYLTNHYFARGYAKDMFDHVGRSERLNLLLMDLALILNRSKSVDKINQQFEIERYMGIRRLAIPLLITIAAFILLLFYSQHKSYKQKKINLHLQLSSLSSEIESKAMQIGDLNEQLNKIQKELKSFGNDLPPKEKRELNNLARDISMSLNKNIWVEFDKYFNSHRDNIMDRIAGKFPHLTVADRRLCAMLSMGLTTKEIASITHKHYKSIEVSRSRLRKKLNLTHTDQSLVDFLKSF